MTRLKRQNPRSFSPTPNNKHIRDHPTTETLAFHMKHLLEPLPHLSALLLSLLILVFHCKSTNKAPWNIR
jgi:hypothetical protein